MFEVFAILAVKCRLRPTESSDDSRPLLTKRIFQFLKNKFLVFKVSIYFSEREKTR